MVGVPRSSGCSVCVKRRVKCDEARPTCARCKTYGAKCPGYEKAFKFVDRAHRRSQGLCDQEQTPEQGSSNKVFSISAIGTVAAVPNLPRTSVALWSRNSGNGINPTICSPGLHQIQCLSNWIEDISRSYSMVPEEVTIARLFFLIPARLGSSNALDMAVRCLTVHHLGITQDNEMAIRYSRLAYGKALSSLQKALYNPVEATKSTTLCAAMILCFYELFACTKADSWMKHAAGVSRLIQLRGPTSRRDAFDIAMLMAFKGLIITEALFAGKYCFLDSEEWRHLELQPPDDESISAQLYKQTEDFARCLAVCPGLVKEAYAIAGGRASVTRAQILSLVHRTIEVYDDVQSWFKDFTAFCPPPCEVSSSTGDPLYPEVWHYCNSSSATVFCGYYATVIILRKILTECRYDGDYANEISVSVDNICKSVEYLSGTGILGPYRLGFSLRVAFEAATVPTKLWIIEWLKRFEKFYGSASPANYPRI